MPSLLYSGRGGGKATGKGTDKGSVKGKSKDSGETETGGKHPAK